MSNYCTCHLKEKCEWCRLKAENNRYREALEFYADEKNYQDTEYKHGDWLPTLPIDRDQGEKARQVLRGETDECT